MRVSLRDYQINAVNDVRKSLISGHRAPLLVLPTASGKTVIFTYITESAAKKGNSVYILVHRQELLKQTSEHLQSLGVGHGIVSPRHSMTADKIQVASVQTLCRRLDRLPEPALIIVDECHHSTAGTWRKILDKWQKSIVLGVTATPIRLDGAGLGKNSGGYYDDLITGPSIKSLTAQGFLSQYRIFAPPSGIDLKGIRRSGSDYNRKDLSDRIDRPTITGCAIKHYLRLCNGVPAVAFCTSIEHAEHVAGEFNSVGIAAAHLSANTDDSTRKYRINALAGGSLKVLTSCDIISEGTDIPVIGAAILLRPTQSLGLYMQQVGRALRICDGKSSAIILDHAGNSLRHGLPDEDRPWSLDVDMKAKKKKDDIEEVSIRQCENCYAVYAGYLDRCPECGCEREVKERKLYKVDGELVELSADELDIMKRERRAQQGMAGSLEDLIKIARVRGYKPGWAHFIWNSRKTKKRKAA